MDKSVVFIDGGYLSKLTKHVFPNADRSPRRIDYAKLDQILASKCESELLRTYYYDCPPHVSTSPTLEERQRQEKFDRFLYSLKQLNKFEVRLGKLSRYFTENGAPNFEQKGVDVRLAIDALNLTLKGKITKAIFVTGDSDFVPVIQAIKDEGVGAFLFYHTSSVHRHILETTDNNFLIDEELIKSVER